MQLCNSFAILYFVICHFFYFKVLANLVSGSGFEDVAYQSRLSTSGSLQGVLAGSHYNRAWSVHRHMAEALERLLLKRFLLELEPAIPVNMMEYSLEPKEALDQQLVDEVHSFSEQYGAYREKARTGSIGKTAQFWLLYMDLMKVQILIQNAVQTNNFNALLLWMAVISSDVFCNE